VVKHWPDLRAGQSWEIAILRYAVHRLAVGCGGSCWCRARRLGLGPTSASGSALRFALRWRNVIPILRLSDFERWKRRHSAGARRRGDFYRDWCGPRIVLSRYDDDLALEAPGSAPAPSPAMDLASVDGRGAYLGCRSARCRLPQWCSSVSGLTVGFRLLGTARMRPLGTGLERLTPPPPG
jgi:hypothetical protein